MILAEVGLSLALVALVAWPWLCTCALFFFPLFA
jgi:hypothetical protein